MWWEGETNNLSDIKRIEHNVIPIPSTYKWAKPDALMHIVKKEDIRLFNFASIMEDQELYLDNCARTKLCKTPEDRLLLVRISEFQRKMFRENPTQIFVDGKYSVLSYQKCLCTPFMDILIVYYGIF